MKALTGHEVLSELERIGIDNPVELKQYLNDYRSYFGP